MAKKTIVVTQAEKDLVDRMKNTGDYIVSGVGGNLWWANKNKKGCIFEAVNSDDMATLWKLQEKGLINHETKTLYI